MAPTQTRRVTEHANGATTKSRAQSGCEKEFVDCAREAEGCNLGTLQGRRQGVLDASFRTGRDVLDPSAKGHGGVMDTEELCIEEVSE